MCDKCDGPHLTSLCPWFNNRKRFGHADAVPLPKDERPPLAPDVLPIVIRGHCEPQPPDGSCLYHSLCKGAEACGKPWTSAAALRRALAKFVKEKADIPVSGKTIAEWLQMERGSSTDVDDYTRRQAMCGWGGSL